MVKSIPLKTNRGKQKKQQLDDYRSSSGQVRLRVPDFFLLSILVGDPSTKNRSGEKGHLAGGPRIWPRLSLPMASFDLKSGPPLQRTVMLPSWPGTTCKTNGSPKVRSLCSVTAAIGFWMGQLRFRFVPIHCTLYCKNRSHPRRKKAIATWLSVRSLLLVFGW